MVVVSEELKEKIMALLEKYRDLHYDESIVESLLKNHKTDDIPDNFLLNYLLQSNSMKAKEIEELKKIRSGENDQRIEYVVNNPSSAAPDPDARKEFRQKQVSEKLCRGGFVCHPMFIAFVKAARSMSLNGASVEKEETKIMKVRDELQRTLGQQLNNRQSYGCMVDEYCDDENVQSGYFSHILNRALISCGAPLTLNFGHQRSVVSSWNSGTIEHRTRTRSSEFLKTPKKQKKNKNGADRSEKQPVKLAIKMDGYVDCVEENGGPIASIEYKPNNTDEIAREAQADMYANNVQAVLDKPCISVNVAGGNRPNQWQIKAYALARRPEGWPGDSQHRWDKCPLYEGEGFEGIVRLAKGIVATIHHVSKKKGEFGNRMGPVVGVVDDRVIKGYDDANTRKPNITLIREFVDEKAKLWTTSVGGKLEILEMKKLDNIWNDRNKLQTPVPVTNLMKILENLMKLHNKGLVHGDIRLSNLLSCGKIVDFDFAGKDDDTEYPRGLQELNGDGERHPDVSHWIKGGHTTSLKMKKEHDLHSMMKVMSLFQVQLNTTASDSVHPADSDDHGQSMPEENPAGAWKSATDCVGQGNIQRALNILNNHTGNMKLMLAKKIT